MYLYEILFHANILNPLLRISECISTVKSALYETATHSANGTIDYLDNTE